MTEPEEWQIDVSYASRSSFKKFNRNHPLEYSSCFANLDKVLALLNTGHSIGSFQVSFLRSEGDGLSRIGQSGVSAAKESRLYVYFVQRGKTVYVLGIGTKETQKSDIIDAKKLIKRIKSSD